MNEWIVVHWQYAIRSVGDGLLELVLKKNTLQIKFKIEKNRYLLIFDNSEMKMRWAATAAS